MYTQTPIQKRIEMQVTNGLFYDSQALAEARMVRKFVEVLYGGSSQADLQLHLAELELRTVGSRVEERASKPLIANLAKYDESIESMRTEFDERLAALKRKHQRG